MAGEIVIREMVAGDIDRITTITLSSFDSYNITMSRLGKNYLKNVFFNALLDRSDAGTYVALRGGGVIGYCSYMKDFSAFGKRLKKKYFFKTSYYLLLALLKFKIFPCDIIKLFRISGWINRISEGKGTQIGPVAVAPEIKGSSEGGLLYFMLLKQVTIRLKAEGEKMIWGTADSRNTSQIISKSFGFEEVNRKPFSGAIEIFLIKKI